MQTFQALYIVEILERYISRPRPPRSTLKVAIFCPKIYLSLIYLSLTILYVIISTRANAAAPWATVLLAGTSRLAISYMKHHSLFFLLYLLTLKPSKSQPEILRFNMEPLEREYRHTALCFCKEMLFFSFYFPANCQHLVSAQRQHQRN